MALTRRRYQEVERQLEQVQDYLASLAGEVGRAMSSADPFCKPCQAAIKAADHVANLRYLLAVAEARRQVSEKQEHSVPFAGRILNAPAVDGCTAEANLSVAEWSTPLLGS